MRRIHSAAYIVDVPAESILPLAKTAKIHSAALREGIPAESILPFRTARELAQETPQEVDWLARPWVATGAITDKAAESISACENSLIREQFSRLSCTVAIRHTMGG
ncbi:MAG: hypothetical protein ACUVWR_18380 [Anaerolineae bacterium]